MQTLPDIAYWFAASDVLPHGDRRKVVIGETLRVDPPLVLYRNGLHCSADPFDALKHAPGPMLYRVRPSGEFLIGDNGQICSSERTALDVRDATEMLRAYARGEALIVAHLWDMPHVVRRYLETGDETIRAAARDAAWAAARAAARDVARDAARDAARAAAWGAAWAAAWDAAWAAARAAARDAARDAAWAAARAAARDAAWAAARKRFGIAVNKLFGDE